MNSLVQVVVNVPVVSGIFDYSIPEKLWGKVGIGHLVLIPFGKQTVQGVVWKFIDQASVPGVKDIQELIDPEPVLTSTQIALAEEMARTTFAPLASMLGLFLPAGINQHVDSLYELGNLDDGRHVDNRSNNPKTQRQTIEDRIVNLLQLRGPLRGRQIDSHFSKVDWRRTANYLVRKGVLTSKNILPPPRVRAKYIRVAQLAVTPDDAEASMESLGMKQTLVRRQAALRFLIHQPHAINLSWIYAETGCNLKDLEELESRGLIRLFENEIFRDPLERIDASKELEAGSFSLTAEQNGTLEKIKIALSTGNPQKPILLQGVTGSGKTEIYIRAAQEVIKMGKQVLVLIPEIALTAQTVRRFLNRFPGQVGLVHSKLSEGERYDTWRRARFGQLNVIIGARSVLFAPLPNIGMIVIDECHDASYHQSEPPFYSAVDAAQIYARLSGAVCLLGSATPKVEQRYTADVGQYIKIDLSKRIANRELPPVHVVDMRDELKAGHRGIFSRILLEELDATLKRREQAILFLNRRGTATYVFCRDCGFVLRCPNCDSPLTLHSDQKEKLMCHTCGYERNKPKICPSCGGRQIREYGLGSEKVEAEIKLIFPKAKTLRWDYDTTRKKDAHEMILAHFSNHKADILIGTQMLAKGLDLPLVTLVGIVLADVGLFLPDPFAGERVFHTLTQVAGRAGRSDRGGKVILQTFDPENQVIRSASRHNVDEYYQFELEQRRRLGYPPFSRIVRLEYRNIDPTMAENEAIKMSKKLSGLIGQNHTLIGPAPCYFGKVGGYYRWQIVVRGSDPGTIIREIKLDGWRVETDPVSLL